MKIIYGRIKEKNIKNLLVFYNLIFFECRYKIYIIHFFHYDELYSHQNLIILKNLHTYKLKKKAHIIQI